MTCRTRTLLLTFPVFLAMVAVPAFGDDATLHARISFESGGGLVKGTGDADWSYATINTLVMPGDTLWVDKSGTMELEMVGGSFLRLADHSKAEILSLPPNAAVRGWTGSFYVQRMSRSTGDSVFNTAAGAIEIDRDAQVRIDIMGEGSTTVSVRWGEATVRTDGGESVRLTSGYRTYVDPGLLPSEPVAFDTAEEDSFDAWNRDRARLMAVGSDPNSLPVRTKTTVVGAADLASYGDWVYVDDRYYWRPTVVTDYVPYRYGHWSYLPTYGYNWVDQYPFAYVTSHYGRWWHHDSYGWLWAYGDVWGPAWVASIRYGPNFVWSPLDPWDRPAFYGSAYFSVGGIPFYFGASTYSLADHLFYGPSSVYGLYPHVIDTVHTGDISIWNIGIGDSWRSRIPFTDSTLQVRDYSPQRVIRGFDTLSGTQSLPAVQRARRLENSLAATGTLAASTRTVGTRAVRTPLSDQNLAARSRSVKIGQDAVRDASSAVQRAERTLAASRGMERMRTARTADTPLTERGAAAARSRETRTTRGPEAMTERGPGRPPEIARTPSVRTSPRETARVDRGQTEVSRPTSRPETRAATPERTARRTEVPTRAAPQERGATRRTPAIAPQERRQVTRAPQASAPDRTRTIPKTESMPRRTSPPSRELGPSRVERRTTSAEPRRTEARSVTPGRTTPRTETRSSVVPRREIGPSRTERRISQPQPRRIESRPSIEPRRMSSAPSRPAPRRESPSITPNRSRRMSSGPSFSRPSAPSSSRSGRSFFGSGGGTSHSKSSGFSAPSRSHSGPSLGSRSRSSGFSSPSRSHSGPSRSFHSSGGSHAGHGGRGGRH